MLGIEPRRAGWLSPRSADMLETVRIDLSGRHPLLRSDLSLTGVDTHRLVLDARRMRFAGPQELAAMVALASSASVNQLEVILRMPEDQNVASYLQRMNVVDRVGTFAAVEGPVPALPREDRAMRLLEVTALSPSNADDIAERLGQMAIDRLGRRTARAAFRGIGELIDNAISHGLSSTGAFVAAQAYSGATSRRPGLEFAVSDTGVGVLAHLRRNPMNTDIADAETALRRALEAGVTGTGQVRGHGLPDLIDATRRGGVGRLVLRSGNAIASVIVRQTRRLTCKTVAAPVDGTWAWLRVRVP